MPLNSFLLGILWELIEGNYLYIFPPNFIKSLNKISSKVGLSNGFLTKIFLIKSMA